MATQPRLVNKQFNSPIGLYSDQNVREVLARDSQILANGAVGINFHNSNAGKPANLQNSAVLRMLEEEEHRQRNGHSASNEYIPRPLRENITWPPPEYETKHRQRSSFKDVVIPGVKRVAWPPPQEAGENSVEQTAVSAQGGPQYSVQSPGTQAPPKQIPLKPLNISTGAQSPNLYQSPISPNLNPSPVGYRPTTPSKQWAPVQSPVLSHPPPQFQPAPQQYQPAPQRYQPAPQQYQPAPQQYQPAPQQYQPAPQQYQTAPQQQYQPAPQQYQPAPQHQYQQPSPQQYQPAPQQYQSAPQQQYQQPSPQQFQGAPRVYQIPIQQYQSPSQEFHPQEYHQQIQQIDDQYQHTFQQYQVSPQHSAPQQNQAPPKPAPQSFNTPQQPLQPSAQPVAAPSQAAPRTYSAPASKAVEPPPSIITLRPQAPVSQAPPPVFTSQPATATLKGGKNLRGDLKWPPEVVKSQMEEENRQRIELARGPACRPRLHRKDYSQFFAQHALNSTYPGYKIPPGTQFYKL